MIGINDVHKFLEENLPDYERRDIIQICKFYLKQRKAPTKKMLVGVYSRFKDFKRFIVYDWQGFEADGMAKKTFVPKPKVYCTCKAKMVVRTNRETGDKFYGCSTYPRCKETKDLEQ